MSELPTEGSPAGIALAVSALSAPFLAVIVGAAVKPRWLAFCAAVGTSGAVLGGGIWYALSVAPGEGTHIGALAFGASGGGLSLVLAAAIVGGRTLMRAPPSTTD